MEARTATAHPCPAPIRQDAARQQVVGIEKHLQRSLPAYDAFFFHDFLAARLFT
jgi:hypothetical protein